MKLEAELDDALENISELKNGLINLKERISEEKTTREYEEKSLEQQHLSQMGDIQCNIESLSNRLRKLEEDNQFQEYSISKYRQQINRLQQENQDCKLKMKSIENDNNQMEQQLYDLETGCSRLKAQNRHFDRNAPPGDNIMQTSLLHGAIKSLHATIDKTNDENRKSISAIDAIHKYLIVIQNMNLELCKQIDKKNNLDSLVFRLSGRFAAPRYLWPRNVPYNDVVKMLDDAAQVKFETDAIVQNALKIAQLRDCFSKTRECVDAGSASNGVNRSAAMKNATSAAAISSLHNQQQKQRTMASIHTLQTKNSLKSVREPTPMSNIASIYSDTISSIQPTSVDRTIQRSVLQFIEAIARNGRKERILKTSQPKIGRQGVVSKSKNKKIEGNDEKKKCKCSSGAKCKRKVKAKTMAKTRMKTRGVATNDEELTVSPVAGNNNGESHTSPPTTKLMKEVDITSASDDFLHEQDISRELGLKEDF